MHVVGDGVVASSSASPMPETLQRTQAMEVHLDGDGRFEEVGERSHVVERSTRLPEAPAG